MSQPDRSITVAAVDLGSNSVHMVIGRFLEQDLHILDRMREPVRLAEGLDEENRLSADAQQRAIECLARFGQRLRNLQPGHVRAVGTNTLRRARNGEEFRAAAEAALGHPIEVISGQEEARLVYLGVAHGEGTDAGPRLVVDIGGGSTEIILGEGFEVLRSHSLFMGCVRYGQQFFAEGQIRREGFREAEIAAQLELRAVKPGLLRDGWRAAIGSSGTINAVRDLLRENGWSKQGVTLGGMKKLRKALVAAGHVDRVSLAGLRPDRARVLPGGLAILIGVFKSLDIDRMSASSSALREGVLYDLVGRIRHEDVREGTIRSLVRRYHVDTGQALRIERTALSLLDQLGTAWIPETDLAHQALRWAAQLHEIGLAVSHTGYHKHGEYLIANSNLPGFSRDDQMLAAALVRGHRRRLSKVAFAVFPSGRQMLALRLCVLLRLAVLLNRSRTTKITPRIAADDDRTLELSFPEGWLDAHPLTRADLQQEVGYLKALKIRLAVTEALPTEA